MKVGDRVQWIYNEPSADPAELIGTVVEVIEHKDPLKEKIRVQWDSGETEEEDPFDLVPYNG